MVIGVTIQMRIDAFGSDPVMQPQLRFEVLNEMNKDRVQTFMYVCMLYGRVYENCDPMRSSMMVKHS